MSSKQLTYTVPVQADLLMICICSRSRVPAPRLQLHLGSPGTKCCEPVPVTVGFVLLGEYHAIADLIGGGAQVVLPAVGSGYNYRRSFTHLPAARLPLCSWFLIGHRRYPGAGGPCYTGNKNDKTWKGKCD